MLQRWIVLVAQCQRGERVAAKYAGVMLCRGAEAAPMRGETHRLQRRGAGRCRRCHSRQTAGEWARAQMCRYESQSVTCEIGHTLQCGGGLSARFHFNNKNEKSLFQMCWCIDFRLDVGGQDAQSAAAWQYAKARVATATTRQERRARAQPCLSVSQQHCS